MKVATVILAAGLGTRMKSSTPKVLHKICGKPVIQYVADAVLKLKSAHNIIVISPNAEDIEDALKKYNVTFSRQNEPKGTGDALKSAVRKLKGFDGTLLVLNGDTPLISPATLQNFLKLHRQNKNDLSLISFAMEGSHSYGRIIREGGRLKAIVEDKDADEEQKKIREVNSGIYAINSDLTGLLKEIIINNKKGEYYLTDIISIASKRGHKVGAYMLGNETELAGINSREELHKAGIYMRDRIVSKCMDNGVSFIDSSSVFISPDAKIGSDTIIYPNVHIEGRTVIGKNCIVYPNTRIISSKIGNNVVIKDSTVIEDSSVKDSAVIGPFAHIRPGSLIKASAKIGNFVEIKRSVIGECTKASHLTYIGDAEIGSNVNIGAGTITCNYDGNKKNKTTIENDVFIGSDSQIIAPVKIGRGAYIGAGSTITRDVPSMSLAVSRTEQKNIDSWAIKRQKSKVRRQKTDNKEDR
ncbi:MAG: bifunctional UDP-N-acetylglucosamine diphosphorylase/glucosamine-1-phosphate N-acetyltransferase GlmU [Thermodesulfovibrionales bacterium]|nr:bifunctional UDP-N-acetylglucosamine diphosphorylase/glucosamine-1-phosphate N-acetyltransferase GlmU [Thermodesulfovibrionales bacterium]